MKAKSKYLPKPEIGQIYAVSQTTRLLRPLMTYRVAAGFPSPAEDYIEGRIDLNKELIRHPLATFLRQSDRRFDGAGNLRR